MNTLEELRHLPRYSSGRIELFGLVIHYNDPLALYHEYNDIFINRIYDFKLPNNNPTILDIGGYIGLSAMYFKTVHSEAKITVFEPDPVIFKLLKKNLKINGFTDIISINSGVGKVAGDIRFFPDGADGGNPFLKKQDNEIEVKMVKLSNFITGTVDLLKVNIEGMEGEVFEEIEHQLPSIKKIILEYHAFDNLPQHLGKILTILDRKGFRYLVTGVPCTPVPIPLRLSKNYKYFNLVYASNTALEK